MKYEIDQSGKVEETNRCTVVAFSNSESGSILLPSSEKKKLLTSFRFKGKPKMYTLQVFSVLIYLLISKYFSLKDAVIIVDKEYKGKETLIRSYIKQLLSAKKVEKYRDLDIRFDFIGKRSDAHKIAISCFREKSADLRIDYKQVIKLVTFLR